MNCRSIALSIIVLFACSDNDLPEIGTVRLKFAHHIDGHAVRYHSLDYENSAGNRYEVSNLQWFISRLKLYHSSGTVIAIDQPFFHYIDSEIPETSGWTIPKPLPRGIYDSVGFVFGLDEEHNMPGQFPNLPESNMIWPFPLGGRHGGYHYMKFNGFWIDDVETRRPFNLHLGVGQRVNDDGEIVGFIQNWFEVRIAKKITIQPNAVTELDLIMHLDSWFDSPSIYDLNVYGGMIMTNQQAMNTLCQNGRDAFTIEQNSDKSN